MNRYRIVGSEAECEPGSNGLVLRNLLSITDPEEMANVEQGLLRQLYEAVLTDSSSQGRLTTRMLTSWHCRWLGNVYAWAGAERTVNVSKDGFAFATAAFIPGLLRDSRGSNSMCSHLAGQLASMNCSMSSVRPMWSWS